MPATGTEYVTLEQLKDLMTNVIQPLADAVQNMKGVQGSIPVTVGKTGTANRYFLSLTSGYSSPVTLNPGDTVTMQNMADGHTPGTLLTFKGPDTFEIPVSGSSSYFSFGQEFSEISIPAVKVYKASGDAALTADDLAGLKVTSGGIVYNP